jgi:hypothetical protein
MPICSPFVDTNVGKITVHTSGTRPTGADRYEGKWIYESDTDRTLFYTGAAWVIMNEPPNAYTPTWTNLTVGNGTNDFTYRRSDGFIEIEGTFTFGTTSTITGQVGMSTPGGGADMFSTSASLVAAQGWYFDTSASARYPLFIIPATTTRFDIFSLNAAAAAAANVLATSATSPVAFGTGDFISVGVRYRMAVRTS